MITYIVSHHDRPLALTCCLASLALQTRPGQVIVCDNSDIPASREMAEKICGDYHAKYVFTNMSGNCYDIADKVLDICIGDWLCFPSDDSYYVPGFGERMQRKGDQDCLDVVLCDTLYDPRLNGEYSVMITHPQMCCIDKTSFIIRREHFNGFPKHEADWRDGALIEDCKARGLRFGKVGGVMVCHN